MSADLSGANLSRTVLNYTDLSGANLTGAKLDEACGIYVRGLDKLDPPMLIEIEPCCHAGDNRRVRAAALAAVNPART